MLFLLSSGENFFPKADESIISAKCDIHYRLSLCGSSAKLLAMKRYSSLQKMRSEDIFKGKVHKYNELSFHSGAACRTVYTAECSPKNDAFKTTYQQIYLCRINFFCSYPCTFIFLDLYTECFVSCFFFYLFFSG